MPCTSQRTHTQLCDAKCNCSIYKQHHASCNTTACACHIMLDVYHRQMDIFIACKLAIIEHSKSKHVSIMMAHASQKERICKIRTLNQRNPQLALLLQSSGQRVCEHGILSSMDSNHQPHLVGSVCNAQHLELSQRV